VFVAPPDEFSVNDRFDPKGVRFVQDSIFANCLLWKLTDSF